MARIKNNLLEGMSGSLGNLVFYRRKGKTVVRQKPGPRKYTPSAKQIFQQKAFTTGQKFLSPLRKILQHFHEMNKNSNDDGVNSALSWILKNAIENRNGEPFINFEKVYLYRGNFGFTDNLDIQRLSDDKILITWSETKSDDFWKEHERFELIAYVPELGLIHWFRNGNFRKTGSQEFLLPWNSLHLGEVLLFGGFVKSEKNRKEYSDIRFLARV